MSVGVMEMIYWKYIIWYVMIWCECLFMCCSVVDAYVVVRWWYGDDMVRIYVMIWYDMIYDTILCYGDDMLI